VTRQERRPDHHSWLLAGQFALLVVGGALFLDGAIVLSRTKRQTLRTSSLADRPSPRALVVLG